MSESQDWESAVAGHGEAFGRVFDAHKARVFALALRLTSNPHDAEDVTAGAFLELWRRRADVRIVDGSVGPWLLTTTANLALNQARGLRRHRAFISRLPRQEPVVDGADQAALLRADLDIDPTLLHQIRTMQPIDQKLLVLVALEDYSLSTAAQALGVSEASARSRWQRIRRGLTHHASHSRAAQLGDCS